MAFGKLSRTPRSPVAWCCARPRIKVIFKCIKERGPRPVLDRRSSAWGRAYVSHHSLATPSLRMEADGYQLETVQGGIEQDQAGD
jgi:hypothetical protein